MQFCLLIILVSFLSACYIVQALRMVLNFMCDLKLRGLIVSWINQFWVQLHVSLFCCCVFVSFGWKLLWGYAEQKHNCLYSCVVKMKKKLQCSVLLIKFQKIQSPFSRVETDVLMDFSVKCETCRVQQFISWNYNNLHIHRI